MLATVRRIVLAVAGAAALVAASRARADHQWIPPQAVVPSDPPAGPPGPALPPSSLRADSPPPWVGAQPPAFRVRGIWMRRELAREYGRLEWARLRFYREGPWSPWQVRRFEVWYHVRRAELDRRWNALAWASRWGWRPDRRHADWGGARLDRDRDDDD